MDSLFNILRRLFARLSAESGDDDGTTQPTPVDPGEQKPEPVHRKVFAIIYNPPIPSWNGRRLAEVMGWNDPSDLLARFIQDIRECSYRYANYDIAEQVTADHFPVKMDGFAYTGDDYLQLLQTGSGFHKPDTMDYHQMLREFDILSKVNKDEVDEVWMFGFPYAGFYESRMGGPDAFFCNAPPLENADNFNKRFIFMGFSYERGVGEMLENMGHRAESIMRHVYRRARGEPNLWERFIRHEKTHPGKSEIGTVHYAPNSEFDYNWDNPRQVLCNCDNWYEFPDLTGEPRLVDSREWGSGDIRLHHQWWLRHLPHFSGKTNGISHNWWEYVIDPGKVH